MTVRERIVAYLKEHPEGVDDDALTAALGLSRRQHANQECRRLEEQGLDQRRRGDGKLRNFLVSCAGPGTPQQTRESKPEREPKPGSPAVENPEKPWYWEGNVQASALRYLVSRGYRIERAANASKREPGKDIIAVSSSGQELWVSVKGRSEGTPRTTPYTQARHYFADALHDLVSWRAESGSASLALALPDFVTYRNRTMRVARQLSELKASVMWVREDGRVEVPPDSL